MSPDEQFETQRRESPIAFGSPPPLLLGGPTATGKSTVALNVAERLGGEIVTVDSMQVYRDLDIGTAKPSPADQARVRHHLIDVVSLDQSFDAARFASAAWVAVREIQARNHVPILSGGTGFYFRAFLGGLGGGPPAEPELRAQLERIPLPELLAELETGDPDAFATIDRQNPRRVIRAIEVLRQTGRAFSAQKSNLSGKEHLPSDGPLFFFLNRVPTDLRVRIDRRVDEMFAAGLVAETEKLLMLGLANNPTAMQAIGYRQVVEFRRGERSLEETIERVKQRSWQLAKRQLTWFRRQGGVTWLEVGKEDNLEELAVKIAGIYRQKSALSS